MRVALFALALTSCATMAPEAPGPAPADACGASRLANLVGRSWNEVQPGFMERSGAQQFRLIKPGDAVTMDHRAERLNLHLDAQDRIVRFTCG